MEKYSYTINMPPITKKNHQQILTNRATGRPFVAQSKQYKAFEDAAGWFLRPKPKPIKYPVEVRCLFYVKTRRRVDKANLEAAAHDMINDHLWEGRYSPIGANGKRVIKTVYAKTRDEAEALLEEMIPTVREEIRAEKQRMKAEQSSGG